MSRYFGDPPLTLPTNYVGLINAAATAGNPYPYTIGPISSSDGGATWTAGAAATLGPSGTGWRKIYIKDPSVVWDGTQYVVYACGWNGSNFQIGRLTQATITGSSWTEYGSNPIIAVPNDGSYRQSGGLLPFVIFDDTDTPKWRMWITGSNAGVLTIGYLSSSDGLTWTDHGRVLNVGTAGDQDDTWLAQPVAIKVGATWHIYYAGYRSATGFFKAMHATCTDPADSGTYTKTGVLSGFSGNITLGGFGFRSNGIRQIIPRGPVYRVLGSAHNAPGSPEESCFSTTATDLITITVPSGLMIPLDDASWHSNSAENPSAIEAP